MTLNMSTDVQGSSSWTEQAMGRQVVGGGATADRQTAGRGRGAKSHGRRL
jgi:hypothetical protein